MLYCTLVYSLCNFIQITWKWSCTYKQAKISCSKAQIRIRKNCCTECITHCICIACILQITWHDVWHPITQFTGTDTSCICNMHQHNDWTSNSLGIPCSSNTYTESYGSLRTSCLLLESYIYHCERLQWPVKSFGLFLFAT